MFTMFFNPRSFQLVVYTFSVQNPLQAKITKSFHIQGNTGKHILEQIVPASDPSGRFAGSSNSHLLGLAGLFVS